MLFFIKTFYKEYEKRALEVSLSGIRIKKIKEKEVVAVLLYYHNRFYYLLNSKFKNKKVELDEEGKLFLKEFNIDLENKEENFKSIEEIKRDIADLLVGRKWKIRFIVNNDYTIEFEYDHTIPPSKIVESITPQIYSIEGLGITIDIKIMYYSPPILVGDSLEDYSWMDIERYNLPTNCMIAKSIFDYKRVEIKGKLGIKERLILYKEIYEE